MAGKNKEKKIIRLVSMVLFLSILMLPQISWLIIKAACGNNQAVMQQNQSTQHHCNRKLST